MSYERSERPVLKPMTIRFSEEAWDAIEDVAWEHGTNKTEKELAAKGKKLPPIYVKDKATGHVSVPHSEFEAQFRNFLDRRDHPEKYIAQEQQQAKPSETPQEQPEPVKPQERQPEWQKPAQETLSPPSQADQERQKIASQRSALMDELQRINAANERRWQEQEQDGEEDAIVKS